MQQFTDNTKQTKYNTIISGAYRTEYKITVGNITLGMADIISAKSESVLWDVLGIGNAVTGSLTVMLPRTTLFGFEAEAKIYVRVKNSTLTSDWVQKGCYFVYKQEVDEDAGTLKLTCYDRLYMADRTFFKSGTWVSTTAADVVDTIADDLGVSVETETASMMLADSKDINFIPSIGTNGTTDREMLKQIAVLYGGNFIIDELGALKIVKMTSFDGTVDVGKDYQKAVAGKEYEPIDRVCLWVNDDEYYRSPDVTNAVWDAMDGAIIEAKCAYATQDLADAFLTEIEGYQFHPLEITRAFVHPQVQMGDKIIANDIESIIGKCSINFSNTSPSQITAGGKDVDQQLTTYTTPMDREVKRMRAENAANFTVLNDRITSEVQRITATEDSDNILYDSSAEKTFSYGATSYQNYAVKSGSEGLPSGNFVTLTYEIKANRSNINFDMYFVSGGTGQSQYLKIHKTVNTWSQGFVSMSYSFDLTDFDGDMSHWRFGFSNGQTTDKIVLRNVKLVVNGSAAELSSTFTQRADSIEASVQQVYEDSLGSVNTLRSVVTQQADNIEVAFTQISSLADDVNAHAEEQLNYIRFSADGVEIGDVQNNTRAVLDDEKLTFYGGDGQAAAYFGGSDGALMPKATVQSTLTIGNWSFIKRSNGHLALKWG